MKVRPTVEPKNVKVTGPGVSSKGIPASIPAEFVVDTTEAGYGDLQVQVLVSFVIVIFLFIYPYAFFFLVLTFVIKLIFYRLNSYESFPFGCVNLRCVAGP